MVKKILSIVLIIASIGLYAQNINNKNIKILFSENEIKTDVELYVLDDHSNSLIKIPRENETFDISKYLFNYTLIVTSKNHVVKIPKIDYLKDINYLEITYYDSYNKDLYEKKYNKKFVNKGKNYQIYFGLENIYYVNYSKSAIKKLKKELVTGGNLANKRIN